MRLTIIAVALLALTGFAPQAAHAAVYDEMVDGDLNSSVTLDLGLGTNTIIGNITRDFTVGSRGPLE